MTTYARATSYVIGLDLGTTRCKAVALNADREVLATAAVSYPLITPGLGRAEQDAMEVWAGAATVLRTLMAQLAPRGALAIALSGAMHSLLLIGSDNEPLAPALTWADQRAVPQAHALRALVQPLELYQRTGCPAQALYHPARIRWWKAHQLPQNVRFVALKDLVVYRLTGEWATDIGMASTSGLLDLRSYQWDAQALEVAGIQAAQLPPLVAPTHMVGRVSLRAAADTGLPAGLPVVAGTNDGATACLGAGAATTGETVITVGTGGAVRRIVNEPLLDEKARTWCYVLGTGRWLAGGAINNGGLTVEWVRARFYPDKETEPGYQQLFADAARVAIGAEGVMMLPYLTGERSPHWNPEAQALLVGLRLAHGREQIARAALESVAFCIADVWNLVGVGNKRARLTGGITRSPLWTHILTDVLGIALLPSEAADASAIGAALLAWVALGVSPTPRTDTTPPILPDAENHRLYQALHERFQRLYWRTLER